MSYTTSVSRDETCGRCEAAGASWKITACGPAELYSDDWLCDDCAEIVNKQVSEWIAWLKRNKPSK